MLSAKILKHVRIRTSSGKQKLFFLNKNPIDDRNMFYRQYQHDKSEYVVNFIQKNFPIAINPPFLCFNVIFVPKYKSLKYFNSN